VHKRERIEKKAEGREKELPAPENDLPPAVPKISIGITPLMPS
jgi:hypothetical protein